MFNDFGVFPFRIGLQTVPTLRADVAANGNLSQAEGAGLSLGTGFIGERFTVELSLTGAGYETVNEVANIKFTETTGTLTLSSIVYF